VESPTHPGTFYVAWDSTYGVGRAVFSSGDQITGTLLVEPFLPDLVGVSGLSIVYDAYVNATLLYVALYQQSHILRVQLDVGTGEVVNGQLMLPSPQFPTSVVVTDDLACVAAENNATTDRSVRCYLATRANAPDGSISEWWLGVDNKLFQNPARGLRLLYDGTLYVATGTAVTHLTLPVFIDQVYASTPREHIAWTESGTEHVIVLANPTQVMRISWPSVTPMSRPWEQMSTYSRAVAWLSLDLSLGARVIFAGALSVQTGFDRTAEALATGELIPTPTPSVTPAPSASIAPSASPSGSDAPSPSPTGSDTPTPHPSSEAFSSHDTPDLRGMWALTGLSLTIPAAALAVAILTVVLLVKRHRRRRRVGGGKSTYPLVSEAESFYEKDGEFSTIAIPDASRNSSMHR